MYTMDSFALGVGDANFAMVNSLTQSLVFRLGMSWLFANLLSFGPLGLYWSECLSPLLPACFGLIYFYSNR